MRSVQTSISKIIIVFMFVTSCSINLIAQDEYLFENLSVADGLSSARFNVFNVVYQDRFGFMWFGTVDGLNRYDGYNFEVFKNIPGDSTSLPSSNIQNINEDAEGKLWIGTPGYMSVYNRNKNSFTSYRLARVANNAIQNIAISKSFLDSKGNFWVATQGAGIQRFNYKTLSFEIVPLLIKVEGVDTLRVNERSAIFGITELKNGNLLISSFQEGIFFYNETSENFEEYSLAGNERPLGIVELYEDRSGNIWFGGRNTLLKYNPITFSYVKIDAWKEFDKSNNDKFFWGFSEFEDGTLFFNAMPLGLCKYSPTNKKFNIVNIEGDLGSRGIGKFPASKFIDKFGVYWIGLLDNGILKFDPKRKPFRFHPLTEDKVNQSDMAVVNSIKANSTNNNELILSTFNKGIFKYDLDSKKIVSVNIKVPEIYSTDSNLRNIVTDDDNKVWFAYNLTSIASYDLSSQKIEKYKILDEKIALGGSSIHKLEYLPKDKLIISTNAGILVFNTRTYKSEKIPSIGNRQYDNSILDEVRKLTKSEKVLVSLTQAGESVNLSEEFSLSSQSEFLIVCLGEGQYPDGMFDFGTLTNEEGKKLWSMDNFRHTFNGGGGVKNRLQIDTIKLGPGKYKVNYATDLGHSYASFNVASPSDSSWYGIQIIKLDNSEDAQIGELIKNEKTKKQYADFMNTDGVLTSRKYPNTIWFGAGNKGLIKYDLTSGKYEQYIDEKINKSQVFFDQLFEDSKGILWVVTTPSGFYRFDPESEKFYNNATIPDVPQTAINSLIEDFDGNIWINSSGGITKLIKPTNNHNWSVTKYDSKDGVPGGIGGGSIITGSGEIFFGSFNGVTAFYPSSENESQPIPVITNLNISEIPITDSNSEVKLENSIYEIQNLSLSFAQNDISFDFASLHYSRPSKNRVSYKLEGYNKDWTYTDRNFASFTNLDPGEYEFRVKAISGYGVPSSEERSIKIIILPPWWRTVWAYTGYVFIFLGLILGIDRLQRRRLLKRAKETARMREVEIRAQLAEKESERKSKELDEARDLQLSMLPKELPQVPNLDIAVYMQTATEVGGDYYDFHIGLDGTLTVVLGDATGHGMKAGTMVTSTKSLFNVLAPNPNIVETFHEITRCLKLMQMNKLSMCMTMLKIMGNKIQMSAAGMPPIFIYKRESQTIEEHVIKGMPLGTFNDFPYSLVESTISRGDTILMMSDGFPELFNADKEMFGYKRTRNLFEELAEQSPEDIISKLKMAGSQWVNNNDPDDDVTFVVIKVK